MSSDLLAYGASDGTLTVCTVSDPPKVIKLLNGHSKDVTGWINWYCFYSLSYILKWKVLQAWLVFCFCHLKCDCHLTPSVIFNEMSGVWDWLSLSITVCSLSRNSLFRFDCGYLVYPLSSYSEQQSIVDLVFILSICFDWNCLLQEICLPEEEHVRIFCPAYSHFFFCRLEINIAGGHHWDWYGTDMKFNFLCVDLSQCLSAKFSFRTIVQWRKAIKYWN